MAAELFIVSTPIGNLSDMTYRAVETLKSVAVIACEDTRHSRKLLDHFGISKPLVSLHEHNEAGRTEELIGRLTAGESVAVISDAGTPLVSDPGFRLVRAAVDAGIRVTPVPGASAVMAALAGSGMATDEFHFAGFLPRKEGERRRRLEELAGTSGTLAIYEAPHRILFVLKEIVEVMGDPEVCVGRELTKLHEEFLRGRASEVEAELRGRGEVKGEFTVLVAPRQPVAEELTVEEEVVALEKTGLSRMDAIKAVARSRGLGKREVYEAMERHRHGRG
ncbi:MAG: 16S rRNA (cytidine(1402)-2'-O)-methyltransferase [Bryobacteraceae bacterium]|nr:16S rRNA (cytidine(1402)-2'-O)-methyltransferase [Bryobacteraceae bacterium]